MEQTSFFLSFYFLVSFAASEGTTTTATTVVQPTTRIPPSTQEIPASPVRYDFAGDEGEHICLILTPQTTAVIRACSSNADLKFSTNLSPSVPINLVQTRDPASMMCQLLIITTNIDNLQENAFDVFYDSSSLQIKYGPLRLSNPNGDHALPFGNGITEVVLRYRPVDRKRTEFQVCGKGTHADFVVTLRQPPDCRLGTGAGGFSSHFDAIVSDIGQNPLSGENFTVTSGPCNNTAAGISFNFCVPEKVSSSTVIIPSTPSLTQSPTSAIISTKSSTLSSSSSVPVTPKFTAPSLPKSSGCSNSIVITVPVVIRLVMLTIGVVISLSLMKTCILEETRKKVEETSKTVKENSTKVDETSKKVEENSINIEETSAQVKENTKQVDEFKDDTELGVYFVRATRPRNRNRSLESNHMETVHNMKLQSIIQSPQVELCVNQTQIEVI